MLVYTLVAFLGLGSLVSSQLILSDDKRLNINDDIDAYDIVSPGLSSSSWNVSPRSLKLTSLNPAYHDSRLYNTGIVRGGSGLSSYTLGGIPAYSGSSIVSLTGTPRAYGSFLDNRAIDLGIQANTRGVDTVRVINRPIEIDTRRVDNAAHLVVARPTVTGVATGSRELRPVTAAVTTLRRTVDYAPVGYQGEPAQTQVVHVPPNEQGIHLNFISKSSPLTVSQEHIPGEAGQVHVQESEDETHRLVHNVKKSVVQEVNEVVQPYRVLKQEVKPVIEEAHTVVAQGDNIPLSGRTSGIIATQTASVRPSFAHQRLALDSARISQPFVISRPEVSRIELAQPEIATINVAQPFVERVALTQPAIQRIAINEPELARVAITQPRIAHVRQPFLGQSGFSSRISSISPNLNGFGYGNTVGITNGNRFSSIGGSIGLESPLIGNIGVRRQNLAWSNPATAKLETNKFILSQPSEIKSKIVRY